MIKLHKGMLALACAALVCAAGVSQVEAADATVGMDLASSYIFRGGTLNDSFVAQPSMELSPCEGVTVGVWANFDIDDDDARGIDGGNFSEIDLYINYDIPLSEDSPVGLSVGYTEYTYPHATGEVDPVTMESDDVDADREVGLVASLDAILSPSLGVYYGLDGAIDEQLYLEANIGHDIEITEDKTLSLGGTLGYVDPDEGDAGFSFAQLSSGVSCGPATLSVAWVIELDDDVLVVDEEIVGTLGFGWDI